MDALACDRVLVLEYGRAGQGDGRDAALRYVKSWVMDRSGMDNVPVAAFVPAMKR
jgi:hypothetical protein